MGGNGGIIIVQQAVIKTLNDPLVHGQLPHTTRLAVDPLLAADPNTWNEHDCRTLTDALHWALCHLS